jgi:translation initiation factor IF-2
MRVNELSKELGKTNREVLDILKSHQYNVTNHASNITKEQEDVVRKAFEPSDAHGAEPERRAAEGTPHQTAGSSAQKNAAPAGAGEAASNKAEGAEKRPQKKRFAAVFHPQNSSQKGLFQRRPKPAAGAAARPAAGTAAKPQAGTSAVKAVKPADQAAKPAAAPVKPQAAPEKTPAVKPAVPEAPKAEAPKAEAPKTESTAKPAEQKPQGRVPRVFDGPIGMTKPIIHSRPTQPQQGQNRTGSSQGRSFGGNRDGRNGGQGRSFGGNRGGYQGRSDGSQGRSFGGNRGGYQGRSDGGQGRSFGGNRDGRTGGYQGRSDGGQGRSFGGNRQGTAGARGGFAGKAAGTRGGFEDKPLQKQQNNKQNRNAYKTDRYSKIDREEERHSKDRNAAQRHQQVKQQKPEVKEEQIKMITLPEHLTVRDLASRMKMQPAAIIKKLFLEGQVVTVNQDLDYEQAEEIALKFDILCEKEKKVDVIAELLKEDEENEADMVPRPPVVCVMGHVDHGKTSLLDAIRKTNVTSKEAGGITQRIGAYQVEINGQKITFLDTPGHEAFTAMRMRGAQATDIAVLVVAADDGVMPQTIEAINHAKAANVELIVAINKIDKPNADPNKVKQELAQYGVLTEDWGGETPCVEVSAHTKQGIPELLEMILLVSEVKELKANPNRNARGLVIEASLDKGRGPVATVLVQKGTLHPGDHIAAGSCFGKVRAMTNENGRRMKEAGPSTPVEVIGFNEVPSAGEVFVQLDSEKEARNFAETYISEGKNKLIESTRNKLSLDDLFNQIKAGNVKELPIIVKADVQGSVEAVKQSLEKLSNEEVAVKVIHSGVGAINESDVSLAAASNAIIIGFNVRPDATAKSTAEHEKVDIRLYKVIYQAIDDVAAAMKGMLEPIYEEKVIGHGVVRQVFKASKVGSIAGSYVTDGKFQRGCKARITRAGEQIFDGEVESLKRFKDDVKEVAAGYECGVVFKDFNDIREEDEIEAYAMVEVPRS